MTVSSFRKQKSDAPLGALNSNPLLKKMFENANIPTNNSDAKSQTWDDLRTLQEACGSGILEVAHEINHAINAINSANINNNELNVTVNGLKRDLVHFTNELVTLKDRHETRTGATKNSSEYAEVMNIGMDYMTYQEKFSGVMFPSLVTLTEFHNEALQQLKAQEETDLTNPAVVSDIEVKEVPNV